MRNDLRPSPRCFLLTFATVVYLGCLPAIAQDHGLVVGNSLHDACTDDPTDPSGVKDAFCVGYVIGVVEAARWGVFISLLVTSEGSDQIDTEAVNSFADFVLNICFPSNANNGQIVDVVRQYLIDNPAVRHEPARGLITTALSEAFPCQ